MYFTAAAPGYRLHPLSPAESSCTKDRRLQRRPHPLHGHSSHTLEDFVTRPSGLRTPPAEEMSTTYQASSLASTYDNRYATHPDPLALYSRLPGNMDHSTHQPPFHPLPTASAPQSYPYRTDSQRDACLPALPQPPYKTCTGRPPQLAIPSESGMVMPKGRNPAVAQDASCLILHSMDLPRCISSRGGSLVDFAAQLTCLFWFESISILDVAETMQSSPVQPAPLVNAADEKFRGWVRHVLKTTQITQNVVLLALMLIYRLKKTNPTVRGRQGSEYRLLTVALMLGNKFLDDNTYTNKTWADVSYIAVKEIHVMEVEFLSNMRYNLMASKDDWEGWLAKLANFWEYSELAETASVSPSVVSTPTMVSSPIHNGFSSPIPSPTGLTQMPPNLQQPATSPGLYQSRSAFNSHQPDTQSWPTTCVNASVSPLATRPDLTASRKRTTQEDPVEPPAKRVSRQAQPQRTQGFPGHPAARPGAAGPVPEPLRLPVPSLTLNTNTQGPPMVPNTFTTAPLPQPMTMTAATTTTTPTYITQAPVSLPLPGVRAMSTVYSQAPATTFAPQLPILTSTGPSTPSTFSGPSAPFSTPSKRQSPNHSLSVAAGYGSSPLTENFGMHTPMAHGITHSPSVYLQQRPSPYKPVRHVNTLLYPPPSASLQEYHLNTLPPNQMHYQHIGRRNDLRTGIVPDFLPYQGTAMRQMQLQATPMMQTQPASQATYPGRFGP